MTMTHAVVLIEAERDALSSLGGALANKRGKGMSFARIRKGAARNVVRAGSF